MAPASAWSLVRRGPHRLVPLLLAAGCRRGAAGAALPPGSRLARGVDSRLLGGVPRAARGAGRRCRPEALPAREPARLLLLEAARAPPAREGRERRGHGARGRVRGRARAARAGAGRARCGVRRAAHSGEARAGAGAGAGAGARAHPRAARRGLRGRSRARQGPAAAVRARARRSARDTRFRGGRARGGGAHARHVHGAAVAARGVRAGCGGGGRTRYAKRGGGGSRQCRDRLGERWREWLRGILGLTRRPGCGDRASAQPRGTRCGSGRPLGSGRTRSGCRWRAR